MVEKKTSCYSPEFRERAMRLLEEHRSDYLGLSAACREIGDKLGCSGDSLHDWWKQAESVLKTCLVTPGCFISPFLPSESGKWNPSGSFNNNRFLETSTC